MIDFDSWRRDYDRLTYSEHVEFYRTVAEAYPEQQHYNEPAIRSFLDGATGPVLELGGWKGELAASVLSDYPGIPKWLNVEIAPQAVTESACTDPRYSVIVPDAFLWDTDLDLSEYRTLVASHVIEHLKHADLIKLLRRTRSIEHLYVDAPLPETDPQWGGGNGQHSHIIEIGWGRLRSLLESYGFSRVGSLDGKWGPAYWFAR